MSSRKTAKSSFPILSEYLRTTTGPACKYEELPRTYSRIAARFFNLRRSGKSDMGCRIMNKTRRIASRKSNSHIQNGSRGRVKPGRGTQPKTHQSSLDDADQKRHASVCGGSSTMRTAGRGPDTNTTLAPAVASV